MSIGILNEGPLHAALKSAYAAHGGVQEVAVESYVADAVRNGIIYEVQTGSFSGLARKMRTLADTGPVVLVHPIARNTRIVKLGAQASQSRLSPKHGALVHIVTQFVYLPTLLNHPNFSVEAVLTDETAVRAFDARKRRGRGGWRTLERHLDGIVDGVRLQNMADLYDFMSADLAEPFGTPELAAALAQPMAIAQKMAYCLRQAGVTEIVGKRGNTLLYRNCRSAPQAL